MIFSILKSINYNEINELLAVNFLAIKLLQYCVILFLNNNFAINNLKKKITNMAFILF